MSSESEFSSDSDKLLQVPKRIALAMMEGGEYSKAVPAIYLSYIGGPALPEYIVDRLDGVAIDLMDDRTIALCIFIPPLIDDDFHFAEMLSLNIVSDEETIRKFMNDVKKIDKFGFVISEDECISKFLVEQSSAKIIDDKLENRYLN